MTESVEQVNMRRRVANGAVWVGVAIIAAYFTLLPAALRAVWPTLLRVIGEDGLATWASMLSAFTWFAVGNLVFLVLYWRRFPFIEQFKSRLWHPRVGVSRTAQIRGERAWRMRLLPCTPRMLALCVCGIGGVHCA
ncbi:hypothetical protein EON67_02785 [archaeon]|nr:MAG: hypothetical protein EON67_02785 [archaeon]